MLVYKSLCEQQVGKLSYTLHADCRGSLNVNKRQTYNIHRNTRDHFCIELFPSSIGLSVSVWGIRTSRVLRLRTQQKWYPVLPETNFLSVHVLPFVSYVSDDIRHMTLITYANMGVYRTGMTAAMQPLALKQRENSLTCPKKEKQNKTKFHFEDFSFINLSVIKMGSYELELQDVVIDVQVYDIHPSKKSYLNFFISD